MTNEPRAFDSFGRIMASGGEQSAALAISRGYSPTRIDGIMSRRFGDDYSSGGGTVLAFAAGMLAAGRLANAAAETGETIAAADVPINGFLPDDELAGSRYKWAADVFFEGANAAVTTYFYTTDLDVQNAINEAIDSGSGIVDNYRQKFGIGIDDDLTPLSVEFISIQGGY